MAATTSKGTINSRTSKVTNSASYGKWFVRPHYAI